MNYVDADTWHQGVGGVGGVGGLTNLWSPVNDDAKFTLACNTTAGRTQNYCYHPGVLFGLTPFALVLLAAWVLPFALSVVLRAGRTGAKPEAPTHDDGHHKAARSITSYLSSECVWNVLSLVWFLLPAWQYLRDPFYQTDIWHTLLALAIALQAFSFATLSMHRPIA